MSTSEQQQKNIQSWHEPALRTLSGLLEKTKGKFSSSKP